MIHYFLRPLLSWELVLSKIFVPHGMACSTYKHHWLFFVLMAKCLKCFGCCRCWRHPPPLPSTAPWDCHHFIGYRETNSSQVFQTNRKPREELRATRVSTWRRCDGSHCQGKKLFCFGERLHFENVFLSWSENFQSYTNSWRTSCFQG
ncbi:uncharacterized protein LOC108344089 isoform X3 [Vigna angularis]|nr:uncharacterized protein LOC108344089 isoform X3 [Vigna angularis]